MQGKYQSWPKLAAAYAYRQWIRHQIADAVSFRDRPRREGCTALIGMCHRLPAMLLGNLKCLDAHASPTLTTAIIVVDGPLGCLPNELERAARERCKHVALEFHYYSTEQAQLTEKLRLPYVFSWLSWSIGLGLCPTKHALLHDYDALILDDALAERYARFKASGAVIQGIQWYEGNGVQPQDQLATTFEAFLDVEWVTSFPPIRLFNQIGVVDGKSRDYDTLLELQHRDTPLTRRTIMAMSESSLVHPSQMIHQYTMLRRHPERPEPCFSLPMIPFFELLSGKADALARATERLRARSGKRVDLFGDGMRANFSTLQTGHIDWTLKQMLRVCQSEGLPPDRALYDYGLELYRIADTTADRIWVGDFTAEQRELIDKARGSEAAPSGPGLSAGSGNR